MIHLKAVGIKPGFERPDKFPFNVPVIQHWEELEIVSPVTLLVGENGTGKSTLLEAIARAAGSITAGSEQTGRDAPPAPIRKLADALRLAWRARTRKGFFLRAEDFFGYVKHIAQLKADLKNDLSAVETEFGDRSAYARGLASLPFRRELGGLRQSYGEGLEVRSHGEQFIDFFQARFVPGGLYLLDEPEAPLSPLRQLGFLSLLKEMVAQEAQFIIVTHSPLLMALPGATILSFDRVPASPVSYEDLEPVALVRDFLNDPEAFLRHL